MATKTDLPRNDELIERHQFYARLAAAQDNNSHDLDGIGKKVTDLVKSHEHVRDTVKGAGTTVRTIVGAAVFIWTLISGIVGWYVQKTMSNYEVFADRVTVLERKVNILENDNDKRKDLPDKVDAVKRLLIEHQRQLDDIEARRK